MTLLMRIITAGVLFAFLFLVMYFGICIEGGAMSGMLSGIQHPHAADPFQAGQRVGGNFVRHNLPAIVLSSFIISLVSSVAISVSGILPWCREPKQTPVS
jgi:hypothetical protein